MHSLKVEIIFVQPERSNYHAAFAVGGLLPPSSSVFSKTFGEVRDIIEMDLSAMSKQPLTSIYSSFTEVPLSISLIITFPETHQEAICS
ncbi:predicted protein [Sclerotinia sclerotiorum 1980 UF-70]|uniref:Uncharacterized protein n=1 Tax=Sclerotinia sclerotiorum (strain ATCC 18683 / 1980 / Ss-1) TaxID=665079 RepID=A7F7P1_SCLS1|nr:predicted protein [Sclerotinia sclerotiorum 1980 UF-70]EDN98762.1 predicted protein [Sclerotinia sclerotiorum 1980 UF-70]